MRGRVPEGTYNRVRESAVAGFLKPSSNAAGFLKPFTNVVGFLNPPVAGFLNPAGVRKLFTNVCGRSLLWQNWKMRY